MTKKDNLIDKLNKATIKLIEKRNQLDNLQNDIKEKIKPYESKIKEIKEYYESDLKVYEEEINKIEDIILRAIPEKTLKLDCATITKVERESLLVKNPLDLFNTLKEKANYLCKEIKFTFPRKEVIDLIYKGEIPLKDVDIETKFSLTVKKNK